MPLVSLAHGGGGGQRAVHIRVENEVLEDEVLEYPARFIIRLIELLIQTWPNIE